MAEPELEWSGDLKALHKQHSSRNESAVAALNETNDLVEDLLKRLALKDHELKTAKLDLEFEADGRRRWQQRATTVEGKIQDGQHILVLVDGNQHFFNRSFLRKDGAPEAVKAFLTELRQHASDQHKHDLPESTTVMVHDFSDIEQLARDLALPNSTTLSTFCQEVCDINPLLTITDCSSQSAITAKIQQFYDLYIENCHCRHVFLALGRNSEYYQTLQMYNDDEYTKSKTSLIRPHDGFSPDTNLSYHNVELSTFGSVLPKTVDHYPSPPLQSLPNGNSIANLNHTATSDTRSTIAAVNGESPATTMKPAFGENKHLLSAATESQEVETSQAMAEELANETFKLQTVDRSSSSSNNTVEQSWETELTENAYTPIPIPGDWGEESSTPVRQLPTSWDNAGTFAQSTRPFRKYGIETPAKGKSKGDASRVNNSWTANKHAGPSMTPRSLREPLREFQGSWDDMVADPRSASSAQARHRSVTSSGTQGSTSNRLTLSAFERRDVDMAEPNPEKRPIWAPIGLNKDNQRIDLRLPMPTVEDRQSFSVLTQTRKLCNHHHLRGACDIAECPFDHEPISNGIYLALRRKARTLPCSAGPKCRQHGCYLGHHCPNVSNVSQCGRKVCRFEAQGMHEIKDHRVMEMIEPSPKDQL